MIEIPVAKYCKPKVYQEFLGLLSEKVLKEVQQKIQRVFPPDWNLQLQKNDQGLSILISSECSALRIIQSIQLIRDFCWEATHNKVSAAIFCKNAQILSASKKSQHASYPIRIAIQGGHKLSSVEYDFVKKIGTSLGKKNIQIITGSGSGAMKASMEGGVLGYWKNKNFDKQQILIGLTQTNILQSEFPNEYVNQILVFPTMEQRLESFFRLSDAIFITVGGVGTVEEIVVLLLLYLKNEDLTPSYYFVCSQEQQDFFKKIFSFLEEFNLQENLWKQKIYCISNDAEQKKFVNLVLKNVEETRMRYKKYCNRLGVSCNYHWNKFLKFSQIFNKKINNNIFLKKEKDPHKSLLNIYQFFSQIVSFTVSSYNTDKKLFLKGDKNLINKAVELLQFFQQKQKLNFDIEKVLEW